MEICENNTYEIQFPKPMQIPRQHKQSIPFELLDPPYKPKFTLLQKQKL